MIATLALAAVFAATPAPHVRCTEAITALDDSVREMYESGQTFSAFLEDARRRRDLWLSNYAESAVPADLLARAQAVPGSWRLLAVAIDACSDSVSTVPYLARLMDAVAGLDMRIVDSNVGRAVMEAHPTEDGRAATPTLILLNEAWEEAGCFIERPLPLRSWLDEQGPEMDREALYEGKMGWYADDDGLSTIRQVVEMMEAAAAGNPICR
jgi:hypothetical protein